MELNTSSIAITATSALSAVGRVTEQTCASIRAGIRRFRQYPLYAPETRDPGWDDEEPVIASLAPGPDPLLECPERLIELALPVLRDVIERARLCRKELGSSALLIGLPHADDVVARWMGTVPVAAEICRRARLDVSRVQVATCGHTAMFELTAAATGLLRKGEVQRCIVLGVDSYASRDRLASLDRAWRLKSLRNVDGFIPGEAASAYLLESPERARARGVEPVAVVAGAAIGLEPEPMHSGRVSTGQGLCAAILPLLTATAGPLKNVWILCDLNGESFRAFEWGVALTRLGRRFQGFGPLAHPADSLGDVGAASGGVLVACAAQGFARGYAPSSDAILWTSSDPGTRAALHLRASARS